MTNREYMIGLLQDWTFIDDGGASYEAMVHYNVKCPYFYGDDRALCYENNRQNDALVNRENCVACKEQWLDSGVDE